MEFAQTNYEKWIESTTPIKTMKEDLGQLTYGESNYLKIREIVENWHFEAGKTMNQNIAHWRTTLKRLVNARDLEEAGGKRFNTVDCPTRHAHQQAMILLESCNKLGRMFTMRVRDKVMTRNHLLLQRNQEWTMEDVKQLEEFILYEGNLFFHENNYKVTLARSNNINSRRTPRNINPRFKPRPRFRPRNNGARFGQRNKFRNRRYGNNAGYRGDYNRGFRRNFRRRYFRPFAGGFRAPNRFTPQRQYQTPRKTTPHKLQVMQGGQQDQTVKPYCKFCNRNNHWTTECWTRGSNRTEYQLNYRREENMKTSDTCPRQPKQGEAKQDIPVYPTRENITGDLAKKN